mgnify:FL=1
MLHIITGVSGHHDPAAVCPGPGGGAAPVRGPGHPLSRHVDCARHEVHEDPQQDPQVDAAPDRKYLLYVIIVSLVNTLVSLLCHHVICVKTSSYTVSQTEMIPVL